MKSVCLSIFLALVVGTTVMSADDTPHPLFDFTGADAAKEWQNINDGVMGGVSEGKFKITDKKTLEFYGKLSLENNGGFASVRTKAKKLGLEKGDTLVAKVQGDGREYSLNLYLNKPLIAFPTYVGANQEGRVDRGQSPPRQVRGDFVWQGCEGRWCGGPEGSQRPGLPPG